jgi:hypothetical protein
LDILHESEDEEGPVVHVAHHHRHLDPPQLRHGPEAPFPCDQLETVPTCVGRGADDERLEKTVLPYGFREVREVFFAELSTRLKGIRGNPCDRKRPNLRGIRRRSEVIIPQKRT